MEGLRRSAWLVIAAALLPLVLFLLFQTGFSAREQRRVVEARALSTTQTVIVAADGEVKRHIAVLNALATARSIQSGDLAEFRERANELVALNEDWVAAQLLDPDGRVLFATDSAHRAIERVSGKAGNSARFAGFAKGPGCPCILFERAASGSGGGRKIIRALVGTRSFEALQPPLRGEYEVSAIITPDGRFIARTLGQAERFAQPASKYVRSAVAGGKPGGVYRGFTLEGVQNYSAFSRSTLTGWTAHVALNSKFVDQPGRRFLASLGSAAAVSIILAAMLLWLALRQARQARALAERMQQSQKLEALGQLTGGIAHDFNNLLTPIVGALDFLAKKTGLDERARRIANGALTSAERAGKLTAQLLAFSRRQKLKLEPIDMTAMLDDMDSLLQQSVGTTHRLEVIRPDEPLCAFSDLNQLELALVNLVINARDASPPGGLVKLTLSRDGETVLICVSDEGAGMNEVTRQRAIEPFFTTKLQGRGTGLGLAQVFGVVEQSGGTIRIDSALGEGTKVTLSLRRCEEGVRARRTEAVEGKPTPPLRLLVIDDDHAVRGAIARLLEEVGHCVDSVSNGATALTAIREEKFDLVLVDFAMPRMDGAELIRQARAIRPETRFLMVTGYADSDAVATAAPDTPLLMKPFDSAELLERVAALGA